MAAGQLNLAADLVAITALQAELAEILHGLNIAKCADNEPLEQERIEQSIVRYMAWQVAATAHRETTEALLQLGYPVKPRMDVPESMKVHLRTAYRVLGIAIDTFDGVAPAVSGTFRFSRPLEKQP
jgi:hypothetical protein